MVSPHPISLSLSHCHRLWWQSGADGGRFEWTAFAIAGGRFLLPTPALTALPETVHTWLSAAPAWWPAYLLPPPWMFVLFEISCMLPRAINAHRWYHRTFGDRYPRDRKIVIPYLL